nr:phage major capsid protein [uncultured Clostridium sp.]
MEYDFSGWATRNNIRCSDGRTILKDAFKHNDGQTVPLVWNHDHNDPLNVLGHALLENRDEGVYAYCTFNDTDAGRNAKALVEHGDVTALSIYANQLKQQGPNVLHGAIREVSLVLAGANPGAFIDSIIRHGEESDEEAIIYTGEELVLEHACGGATPKKKKKEMEHSQNTIVNDKNLDEVKDNFTPPSGNKEKTVQDVFDTLNEEQKTVVYALIGQALDDSNQNENNEKEGNDNMKHNVFDQDQKEKENVLTHADMETIISEGKRYGSLKDSFLAHTAQYGIDQIDFLFPDAKNVTNQPDFIKRDDSYVQKVLRGVHHTPFSRIKSTHANITADEARAKGYIKGHLKKEEVFTLLKRTTTPTTIYKKQKMDRDDIIDITDFDVVAYIKAEMRMMLDEEIARAILVGDGRSTSSDDKIPETNIRPIAKDDDLYTIKAPVAVAKDATEDAIAKAFIRTVIKTRKEYKGSGSPTLFTTEDMLTNCLLLEDNNGRIIYDSVDKLATTLRVKEIVPVEVMEGVTRTDSSKTLKLMAILVNLNDYYVGADKGGAINMFDDFDIDYNQEKYLIETRISGALVKPYSAIAFELDQAQA